MTLLNVSKSSKLFNNTKPKECCHTCKPPRCNNKTIDRCLVLCNKMYFLCSELSNSQLFVNCIIFVKVFHNGFFFKFYPADLLFAIKSSLYYSIIYVKILPHPFCFEKRAKSKTLILKWIKHVIYLVVC